MHEQQARPRPTLVSRTCNRTSYPTQKRAEEVLWLMGTRGIDTCKLRVIHCQTCFRFHLQYVSR